ncbi:hypothetical protein NEOLEDRAFT_1137208 [Neolentinus lepideus HHB14362 ss-1]|uniref:RanBP2-type domain-containing protein n=1 Tax=Neolentinus lepideus HHB14362 ss-1 TaxID=1314782 RepID=A0A165QYH3_9AGAM|nr:hypothetical protein NEOLEDRAFT_1137208 [Neolentinus lepideus HHB14362 ss-1]
MPSSSRSQLALPALDQSFTPAASNQPTRPIIRVMAPAEDGWSRVQQDCHEYPTIIDTVRPRQAPASGCSVVMPGADCIDAPSTAYESFLAQRSRVVRMFNLPPAASSFLSAVFCPSFDGPEQNGMGLSAPVTMWSIREGYCGPRPDEEESVWAVFRTHNEAVAALALDGALLSVVPALEHELLPFQKLQRFELSGPTPAMHILSAPALYIPPSPATSLPSLSPTRKTRPTSLRSSLSTNDMHAMYDATRLPQVDRPPVSGSYTLSTNPPAARANFRMGDWMCPAPNCAVHNFQRNLSCIGCGSARPVDRYSSPEPRSPIAWSAQNRVCPSPRFMGMQNFHPGMSQPPLSPLQSTSAPLDLNRLVKSQPAPHSPLGPKTPAYPILTPSGRALAAGGKVQNVSIDPFSPCLMWWPDNEPLPEQSQIRPSGLIGVQHPPILNTGNRGPIEHQPGDWVCGKCSYLNWRRRKVCQTCFPYAEGNGDSISAAVQAERIALLASVIAKEAHPTSAQMPPAMASHGASMHQSHPVAPQPQPRSSLFIDISPELRSTQSRTDLPSDDTSLYMSSRTIYQTSGHSQPSTPSSTNPAHTNFPQNRQTTGPAAPLLPSFLHDMVRSPSLSPASTSSAFSLEDFDESFSLHGPAQPRQERKLVSKSSFSSLGGGNIWRLDGEESKALSTVNQLERQFALVDISR